MERALVLVDSTDGSQTLLAEAGEFASGADAELVLLALVAQSELDGDLETLERIAQVEGTAYDQETVLDAAARSVEETANDVLADLDVPYEGVADLVSDSESATILAAAEEYDCDHLFVAGRKRSPTGKAVFGDTTQAVLLNFDGPVTVTLE